MDYKEQMKLRLAELDIEIETLQKQLNPLIEEKRKIEDFLFPNSTNKLDLDNNYSVSTRTNNDFPHKSKIKEKVLYALEKLEEATAQEIIKYLQSHEPDINSGSVTFALSSLKSNKEIQAVSKDGRAVIYGLPFNLY